MYAAIHDLVSITRLHVIDINVKCFCSPHCKFLNIMIDLGLTGHLDFLYIQEVTDLVDNDLNSIKQELSDFSNTLNSFRTEDWSSFPNIDLYMDQVITYLEGLLNIFSDPDDTSKIITSSMVNNYVKEGYLKRPVNKKYDKVHLVTLYIMSMLKPVLPIPLIAKCLSNFENEQKYQTFFEELTKLQDEAFTKVSDKISSSLDQINGEDYETALRLFALQLTSEANAHRIAAEKILSILEKNSDPKQASKEKSK